MRIAVTRVALRTALGSDPVAVRDALVRGESGLSGDDSLAPLGRIEAGRVGRVDLRPWLKRRKDRKLMARPSELLLPVLGEALGDWAGDRDELGLFVGVGREPPDEGASEPALAAAARGGALDTELLAGPGRDRYPPLLPLRTLPNMALAHGSIHLGIGGENGAWAGGPEAGIQAVRAGWHAVAEGRAPAALVAATESQVDVGSARDLLRLGRRDPPGEAAAALLIEPVEEGGLALLDLGEAPEGPALEAWRSQLGDCGAAEGALAVVLAALGLGGPEARRVGGPQGVRVRPLAPC